MAEMQQKSGGTAKADAGGLREVALDDKYDLAKQQIFLTGTQAIARVLMLPPPRSVFSAMCGRSPSVSRK